MESHQGKSQHAQSAAIATQASNRPVHWGLPRWGHALVLAAAVAVPALGAVMSPVAGERVAFAGLESYPLPSLCLSRQIGIECATCGMTRSVIAFMHGEFATSFRMHRFGWWIVGLAFLQIPWRSYRLVHPHRPFPRVERVGMGLLIATGVLIVANRFLEAMGV